MNFLMRAFYAVTRKKSRSIILLVILVVIANMILAGISIQSAADESAALARQKIGSEIVLQYDAQKLIQAVMEARRSGNISSQSAKAVTEDMVGMVATLDHIIGVNLIANASANAGDFEHIALSESQNGQNNISSRISGMGIAMPEITIVGESNTAYDDSFSKGTYTLVEGTHVDAPGLVLIEKQLAEHNGISVGDKITVEALSEEKDPQTFTLTVSGIYDSGNAAGSGNAYADYMLPYNKMYVQYKTAMEISAASTSQAGGGLAGLLGGGGTSGGISSAMFFIDDPENMDAVINAAKALPIDWNSFTISYNTTAYDQLMGPINNVASFSKILVVVVVIAGIIILALILSMWIRERSYETGVMLSMGESNIKVVGQYIAEITIIAVLAFSLSVFTGMYTSQAVGDVLLSREVSAVQSDQNENMQPGSMGRLQQFMSGRMTNSYTGASYDPIDNIDVNITLSTIAQLFGIGMLLILLATALPASAVMRYNPKTILTRAT